MDTLRKNTITLKCLSLILSIGFSFSLLAEAGTSLFVYGNVQLKSAQGDLSNFWSRVDLFFLFKIIYNFKILINLE